MFIDVSEIRKSPGESFHFDFSEKMDSLEVGNDEISFKDPVSISLDVKNVGNVLNFKGSIKGETVLTCSRCLETYPFHLETDFDERFIHESDIAAAQEDGIDTEDMQVIEGNKIELGDIVSESILLNIPMKLICSENCRGLCSVCGINLNNSNCNCKSEEIDPRLGVLKKFFE